MLRYLKSVGKSGGTTRVFHDVGMSGHAIIMHNASANVKCQMHHTSPYFVYMDNASERLKAAREKSGYSSAKMAAEAMGVSVATYVQHENGTRGYPVAKAERYAKFFRVTPEWLLYGRSKGEDISPAQLGPLIFIQGSVAAGVFKERMEIAEEDWETFTGSPDVKAPISNRFGLRVEGRSMDLLYPPGTVIECVRYWGNEPIPNGKRVIVQRTHEDGRIETTVKEYAKDESGTEWLVPRSSLPEFQTPFRCDQPEPGIARIEIVAVVVASIRYE